MLYLIRTFGIGKRTSLKIGYTEKLDERFSVYKAHNPFFEVVSTRRGDKLDEIKFHLYLEALGYKDKFMNEWFIDCVDVHNKFHSRLDEVEKVIWKYRDAIFEPSDFKTSGNKLKCDVYELLSSKFSPDITKSIIDREWLKIQNLKFLRNQKKERDYMKKFI